MGLSRRPGPSVVTGLPDLPDLRGRPRAMVEHLGKADEAARRDPNSADAVGALGMAYHADVFYDRAAHCYAAARKLAPKDWRWAYYVALLREDLGQVEAAAGSLREAVALNPDYAVAWYRLARAAFKQGLYDAAEKAYRRADSVYLSQARTRTSGPEPVHPSFTLHVYATYGLARVAMKRGRPDLAMGRLEPASASYKYFDSIHRLLARAYRALGRTSDAEELLAGLSARRDKYAPPPDRMVDALVDESCDWSFILKHVELAKAVRRYPRAVSLAYRAEAVSDEHPDAALGLGLTLLQVRRVDDALPYLERFARGAPDNDNLLFEIGLRLCDAKRWKLGAEYYRKALRANPRNAKVNRFLGSALLAAGQPAEAIDAFRDAVRLDQKDVTAHALLLDTLLGLGKLEQARRHLGEAARINPALARAWPNVAAMAVQRGEFAQAVQDYRTALRYQPEEPLLLSRLVWLLATCPQDDVRNGTQAVQLALWACRITGRKHPAALDALAAAYAETGEFALAAATVQEAIAIAVLAGKEGFVKDLQARQSLYLSRQPYRRPNP